VVVVLVMGPSVPVAGGYGFVPVGVCIEPARLDQGLTITYVASSQQLGELELKIVTGMPR
jgi:hypothetical protein